MSWWNDVFRIAAWVLALVAALTAGAAWLTSRELDARRKVEIDRLRERTQPRVILRDQRERMRALLRQVTGDVVIWYPADVEAKKLAEQLETLLAEAGWAVKSEGVMSFGPTIGLQIEVKDVNAAPTRAQILKNALGIEFDSVRVRANSNLVEAEVVLVVGSKPID